MNNTVPKISVVMSVYNGQKYLREAIDSILNQTFKEFEFIVIDDGSTDKSVEIIKSYVDPRIILIKQENQGLAAALNGGIKIAKGKYIARMDADDISEVDRFSLQLQYMENNNHCVAVGSLSNIISKDGDFLYLAENTIDSKKLKTVLPYTTPFAHGSSFIRVSAIRSVGGYHEQMRFGQDMLLWIDLAELGDFAIIPKPLYNFRITPFSNSRTSKKNQKIEKKIFYEYYRDRTLNIDKIKLIPEIGGGLSYNQKMSKYHKGIGVIDLIYKLDKSSAKDNFYISLKYDISNIKSLCYYVLCFFSINFILKLRIIINCLKNEIIIQNKSLD